MLHLIDFIFVSMKHHMHVFGNLPLKYNLFLLLTLDRYGMPIKYKMYQPVVILLSYIPGGMRLLKLLYNKGGSPREFPTHPVVRVLNKVLA